MKLLQFILSLFLIYIINSINAHPGKDKRSQKMILILADGIRYDYVNDEKLVGFKRMAKNGVKAEYVQPIFPANSYPNWYTIVTGQCLASYNFQFLITSLNKMSLSLFKIKHNSCL